VGINQRVSLRKFVDDVKRWVDEGRSDDWIASALGTSSSSVQSFRSRNGIYRKNPGAALAEPVDYEAYEGVVECPMGTLQGRGSIRPSRMTRAGSAIGAGSAGSRCA
jgi:hypothetical protein